MVGKTSAASNNYSAQIGNSISQNCAVIQNTLKSLRQRDISTRVSRVYVYEFLLQRTEAFSTRLENNKLSHISVDKDNNNLNAGLNKFKDDYDEYDNNLQSLISINCQLSPEDFYNQLLLVRVQRTQLHTDVINMQKNWQQIVSDISSTKLNNENTVPSGGCGA